MAFEALELVKRALAVHYLQRENLRKLSNYLYSTLGERFKTSTSINMVPAMKSGSSKSYFVFIFS
jgi:hypothetical protein